jgi:hypothetical protein
MRATRLCGSAPFILVLSCLSGCAYEGGGYWPAGTAAFLQDRDAPRVLAEVPPEQRAVVKRRSLTIPNHTPVTVIDDPAYDALSRNSPRSESPTDPVRVRVTRGVDQEIELIARRQDLALSPEPEPSASSILAISFWFLVAGTATRWPLETLVLKWKHRREVDRDDIAIFAPVRAQSLHLTPRRSTPIADRSDAECDQWLAWVAAMTARRKLRCVNSCRRTAAPSH